MLCLLVRRRPDKSGFLWRSPLGNQPNAIYHRTIHKRACVCVRCVCVTLTLTLPFVRPTQPTHTHVFQILPAPDMIWWWPLDTWIICTLYPSPYSYFSPSGSCGCFIIHTSRSDFWQPVWFVYRAVKSYNSTLESLQWACSMLLNAIC
jgi:hypothetical protein